MRRVLYLVLCLSGCLLIVLLVRARRATREQMTVAHDTGGHERDPVAEPSARVIPLGDRPAPAPAPAGQREETPNGLRVSPEAAIALAHPINGESGVDAETARRRRMADVRAEMADVISHGVLFSMAHERGVSGGLVVASRWDLLDAILRAEGLRAEDDNATIEDAERLDQLLREAHRRDAEATTAARALEADRTIQTSPPRERRHHHS
ncbi:MAG: hypothetical protein ACHP9U_06500 [Steroidobacterales bacterium]